MDTDEIVKEDHEFLIPKKAVTNQKDMPLWEKSEAYMEYVGFILAINDAIKGKPNSVQCAVSDITQSMIKLVDILDKMIDETPPIDQPQRYGNKAFREFYEKLKERGQNLLREALPEKFHRAVPELTPYLIDGFGNSTRIDYGTGHEMSFLMLLCCMFKIGAFIEEDKVAVANKIFNRYLILVRKLLLTYRMEPAGSHGVWSLDDHQFVPFIWGSSQLIDHPRIEPKSFVLPDIVQVYAKEYMFIGCIEYINKVKTGLFAEHSNQLWNISAVTCWRKINAGLVKMYKVEVLGKFPVIQHVVFGSLLPLMPAPNYNKLFPPNKMTSSMEMTKPTSTCRTSEQPCKKTGKE